MAIALGHRSPEKSEATMARIEREAQRLEVLVGELLALARAEHGETVREDYFDLAELVGSVTEDARFEAAASEVRIRLRENLPPEDECPLLIGNAELVHRALDNILRNALRFSAVGQDIQVDISYAAQAGEYRVEIADSGPGIPDAEIDTMFHPFVRGDDMGSGFGLGLSIASRAVMAHGGTVKARNCENGGFVVSMTFPVTNKAPRPAGG
jgi:two-component system OmpR family sensor kinase